MALYVRVQKRKGSLAVRIPKRFGEVRNIKVGTILDLDSVRVVPPRLRRYRLSDLLRRYKPRHRHDEWRLGGTVGREIW